MFIHSWRALAAAVLASLAAPALAAQIGPDAFGYTAEDVSISWTDISGTGTATLLDEDDATTTQNIGFTFSFYGVDYTTVSWSPNGLLTFGGSNGEYSNQDLTTTAPSGDLPSIAVYWDDIVTYGGADAVWFETTGSAGSRQFIVQWHDVSNINIGTADRMDFEVVLFEWRRSNASSAACSSTPISEGVRSRTSGAAWPQAATTVLATRCRRPPRGGRRPGRSDRRAHRTRRASQRSVSRRRALCGHREGRPGAAGRATARRVGTRRAPRRRHGWCADGERGRAARRSVVRAAADRLGRMGRRRRPLGGGARAESGRRRVGPARGRRPRPRRQRRRRAARARGRDRAGDRVRRSPSATRGSARPARRSHGRRRGLRRGAREVAGRRRGAAGAGVAASGVGRRASRVRAPVRHRPRARPRTHPRAARALLLAREPGAADVACVEAWLHTEPDELGSSGRRTVLGMLAAARGDWTQAAADADEACAVAPHDADAHILAAFAALRQSRRADVETHVRAALSSASAPLDVRTLAAQFELQLALASLEAGRITEAAASARAAIVGSAVDEIAVLVLARSLGRRRRADRRRGRPRARCRVPFVAARADPPRAEMHLHRAEILASLDRRDPAASAFAEAQRLDGTIVPAQASPRLRAFLPSSR